MMDNMMNSPETQNLGRGVRKMKKSTKILMIVMSIVFMLTAVIVPVVVFTLPKDPGYQIVDKFDDYMLRYRPGEDYYDIVSYLGDDEEVEIPAVMPDGVRVRGVLDEAFSANLRASNANIVKVTFETIEKDGKMLGVESIGERAFEGCSNLFEIIIPSTVISLGTEAFSDSGLQKLVVENADVLKLEKNALTGANNLTTLSINSGVVNKNNLVNYGSGSKIDNIEIGNSVSEISPDAFDDFNLNELTTLSVYNIETLKFETSSMGENKTGFTCVNILPGNPVLTSSFMEKIANYCGGSLNRVNVYKGINVIESNTFTHIGFKQFNSYGNNIYIYDDAVIDIGAFSENYKYTIHLLTEKEDGIPEVLNIKSSENRSLNNKFSLSLQL